MAEMSEEADKRLVRALSTDKTKLIDTQKRTQRTTSSGKFCIERTKASSTATLAVQGMSSETVNRQNQSRRTTGMDAESLPRKRNRRLPDVAYSKPMTANVHDVTTEW